MQVYLPYSTLMLKFFYEGKEQRSRRTDTRNLQSDLYQEKKAAS